MIIAAHVAAGILAADLFTAAVHWFEDTYLPWTDRPGVLGDIARDNELHHAVPFSIASGSWWDNMRVSVGFLVVAAAVAVGIAPRWVSRYRWALGAFVLAAGLANLVHRFQHERPCGRPAVVDLLQRLGVLCDRDQHAKHHRTPDVKYGVLLGFTNVVYDLGLWRALELILGAFGARPARKPAVDSYAVDDPWLDRNLARECPVPIPRERLEVYKKRLADRT